MSGRLVAIGSLLLVMLVWGSAFVVTKSVLDEIPPLLLALLRFAVASAILVPLVQLRGGPALLARPLPLGTLALMGLCGVTLFFVGTNLGLVYTTVTDASLIQGSIPAITTALAIAVLGEPFSRVRTLGIGASMLGVALIVLAGGPAGDAPDPLLGDLLVLLGVMAWAIYTILGKRLQRASQLAVTAYSTLLGTLLLIPFAAYELAGQPPPTISAGGWLVVIYLGAGASALCYLLWNWALQSLDASQAANFINLIPLVGVGSAALFLGETLGPSHLLGGCLVLAGVWVSSRPAPATVSVEFDSPSGPR